MPEEIDHTVYASNSNYEKAVAGHIAKILNLQDMASKCNEEKIWKSQEYFDRKYVEKLGVHSFAVGNVVLMKIKKRIKDIKNVGVRWIGPLQWSMKDQVNFLILNMNARVKYQNTCGFTLNF